ncbi:hypothetical protein AWC17_25750 [Mycobacterium nebraskense]|uniref:Nucleoside phosphorylase domain-containing protein n=1 Tax=Mycobacterium nebraskense TaxID=244292 RepID=A0A1X1ZZG1_9MYCO|nr:hypothetical protein [Mycobacterium nebraskense]KKC05284.1 hypothetical protein WU83_09400 [Mycobacterium nebraskense]MCV7115755.1 hypothetical protein [Mycobacterium nebraskense]ORW31417.1 hypothetical protein AWC17_25750 [Mycobacterium nebraskense]
MADVTVAIFTFTRNEATAVTELLARLYIDLPVFGTTVWTPTTQGEGALEGRLSDGRTARLEHHPLSAQGNVVAAAALSRSTRENRADYYVFYGCCGTVDPNLVGQVFRAERVSYLSLGVVVASPDGEVVKLKNKWIVRTHPNEQAPLDAIEFRAGSAGAPGSVSGLDLPDAHVLATDKVIKVSPGIAPMPIETLSSGPVYASEDWTYSLALALYSGMGTHPVLVDMESFGIASAMRSLGLCERVLVLRVVTDALSDKADQRDEDQLDFLRAGLPDLAAAISTLLGILITPERKPRTLEDEVHRLRAGIVMAAPSTHNPEESEMVRVVSAASLAWDGQLDRVDRFSRPLLPSGTLTGERANPGMTARLFLAQVASDYRRVASVELDLRAVEAQRTSGTGVAALERAGVVSRPVAPLVVGQYLASQERAADADLESVLQPWMVSADDADLESQCAAAFGEVLGPLVRVALNQAHDHTSMVLPDWSSGVGDLWCKEFLVAGAEILKDLSLLSSSEIQGGVTISSGDGPTDAPETINKVVALAEAFRPVEDVRVSGPGNQPKIDLVLSGDRLGPDELNLFLRSVQDLPADVMILPNGPDD